MINAWQTPVLTQRSLLDWSGAGGMAEEAKPAISAIVSRLAIMSCGLEYL